MAYITQRIFSYVPKKAIMLGGEEWTRTLNIYNGWSRLRIGMLCAITPDSTRNIQSAFTFGLCSSTGTGSGTSAANAVGVCLSGSIQANYAKTLTYTAGGGNPYFLNAQTAYFSRSSKGILTETTSTATAATFAAAGLGNRKRRTPVIIDFNRQVGGGGPMTMSLYATGNSAAAYGEDFRPDHLMDGIDQVVAPNINGQALSAILNAVSIATSDFTGGLDSFFIFWQRTLSPLEVYAIGASIIQPLAYSYGSGTDGAGGAVDYIDSYANGTATHASLVQGFGWSDAGVINGTVSTPPGGVSGYYGTSCGYPYDSFEDYSIGTIVSGATLNSGLGWSANGVIN